ncbi:MAG: hypothetical protein K1X28_10870 [Parachlamydiales bacterium]|nr:hypothetical protein [Parachlamydiales bacterium]
MANSITFSSFEKSFRGVVDTLQPVERAYGYQNLIQSLFRLDGKSQETVDKAQKLFDEAVSNNVWSPKSDQKERCQRFMEWAQREIDQAKDAIQEVASMSIDE